MRRGGNRQLIDVLDPENLPEELEREIAHLRRDENYARLIASVIGQAAAVSSEKRTAALLQGLDLVEQLMVATNRPAWESKTLERDGGAAAVAYVHWRHVDAPPLGEARRGELPVRLDDAVAIAAGYLKLPFRVDELDRQLLDMMIAAHIGDFVAAASPHLRGRAGWLKIMGPVAATATLWGALWLAPIAKPVAVAWALLGLAVMTFALRSVLRKDRLRRQRAGAAVEAMQRTYALLAPHRSALDELENHVASAQALGASWPPVLIALLDDILMRRITI